MVLSPFLPVSFPDESEALLFGIAYWGWVATEIAGAIILPRIRQRRNGAELKTIGRGSAVPITTALIASILVAFWFSGTGTAPLPGEVFFPGLAFMIAGIVLRQWAIAILGRFFSTAVCIQAGQSIVREGPYRFVRHPAYAGSFLIIIGVGLCVRSWGALLVLVLIFGIVMGHRIAVEEKALIENFGEEYAEYMKHTKRLIPFVF
jgi:protein-S-isoprenylcysteine O-methyltransferase Ste14